MILLQPQLLFLLLLLLCAGTVCIYFYYHYTFDVFIVVLCKWRGCFIAKFPLDFSILINKKLFIKSENRRRRQFVSVACRIKLYHDNKSCLSSETWRLYIWKIMYAFKNGVFGNKIQDIISKFFTSVVSTSETLWSLGCCSPSVNPFS